jgi:3-phosphoshikimate 1-carboxyvinyltransferase
MTLKNLNINSFQGDSYIAELSKKFGINSQQVSDDVVIAKDKFEPVEQLNFALHHYPDLSIPLIVACAIKYPTISITGLSTLAFKESNRLEALTTELNKINIQLHYHNETLTFTNNINTDSKVVFDTYNDHRIAMALSLLAIVHPQVTINDYEVVVKSFPDYWQEINKIGIKTI